MSQPNTLKRIDLQDDPIAQFCDWYEKARILEATFVDAMTVATSTPDGAPSARMALLRGVDEAGFRFFTNYESLKAYQISQNPQVALAFYWHNSRRQVRIQGDAEKLSTEESDAYFASRPRGSQLGAWASHQSAVIANRDVLLGRRTIYEQRYSNKMIPRPPNWGGYLVTPHTIEFWQNGEFRLHDRFRYTKQVDDSWLIQRLSP